MLPSRGSTAHWERVDSLSWPQRSIAFSGRSQEWLLIQTQGDTHADHTFVEDFLPNRLPIVQDPQVTMGPTNLVERVPLKFLRIFQEQR